VDAAGGGCAFNYRCAPDSVCIRTAAGQDACAPLNPQLGCSRVLVRTRAFLVCNSVAQGWFDSTNACDPANTGFTLASVRNSEEQAALAGVLAPGTYWIGLTDRSEQGISVEGTFVWQDGTPLFFGRALQESPWCPGQPSASTPDEDCVALGTNGACWQDEVCTNPIQGNGQRRVTGFICAR
jgi:hypothetical protein